MANTQREDRETMEFSTLEVDPNCTLPQLVPSSEKEVHHRITDYAAPRAFCGGVSKKLLVTYGLVTFVVLGASLGGAIGGVLGRRSHLYTPSKSSSSSASSIPSVSTAPSPSAPSPDTLLLNTSIAAITLANGDRRVYFQDASGRIREAQHTVSDGRWLMDSSFVVTEFARNGTSIAVDSAEVTSSIPNETATQIGVVVASGTPPYPALYMHGGSFESWTNTAIGIQAGPPCSLESRFVFCLTQNESHTIDESLYLVADTWLNIFYQPMPNGSSVQQRIFRWSDITSSTTKPIAGPEDFIGEFFDLGRSFAVELVPNDFEVEERYFFVPKIRSEQPDADQFGFFKSQVNLWTGVQKNYTEDLIQLQNLDIHPYADFAALHGGHIYWLDSNSTLRTYDDDSEPHSSIQLPFPRFAMTTARSQNTDLGSVYMYFQQNGTHLAEVAFQGGYWNFTPTWLPIS